jgi:hypothetical protein
MARTTAQLDGWIVGGTTAGFRREVSRRPTDLRDENSMRMAGGEPAGGKRSRSATERQAGQPVLRRDDWRPPGRWGW